MGHSDDADDNDDDDDDDNHDDVDADDDADDRFFPSCEKHHTYIAAIRFVGRTRYVCRLRVGWKPMLSGAVDDLCMARVTRQRASLLKPAGRQLQNGWKPRLTTRPNSHQRTP